MSARRIAVIPARGGSKRLPRKNVVDFLGRPIIAHSIEAALATELFERVIVSTDDDEIAAAAQAAGAEIEHRPVELAADGARVIDVCLDLLDREEAAGRSYDLLCALYATAPLRTAEDIASTVTLVDRGACAFAMAVTRLEAGVHQAMRVAADGTLEPVFPDLVRNRASELPPCCLDNGSTYVAAVDPLRQARTWYGTPLRGHEMPRERSVDIDIAADLELARFFGEQRR